MTEQHPITPPPELVKQWVQEVYGLEGMPGPARPAPGKLPLHIANQAARWGYDQAIKELEAFLEKGNDQR